MATGINLLVFRITRQRVSTGVLRRELSCKLQSIASSARNCAAILDSLLRAGELECGLFDCNWPEAKRICSITDTLASCLLQSEPPLSMGQTLKELSETSLPEVIEVSPPEGFAYFALHPRDFAAVAKQFNSDGSYAVIGIRTIGTVLSAVLMAALQQRGMSATRSTVRPCGHPYDRITNFNAEQIRWIHEQRNKNSKFVVVDEGPGLSGSSFLSLGEALLKQGVANERILLLGTRGVQAENLCTPDAAARFSQFRWECVKPDFYARLERGEMLGGGTWRESFLTDGVEWPACWPQMERLKSLSAGGKQILKFEGLGRFGNSVRERAECVSREGFGPACIDAGDGLLAYDFIRGKPLYASELSPEIIEHIARYCAFRLRAFPAMSSRQSPIGEMLRFNLAQEFGLEVGLQAEEFCSTNPVVTDGRMQPHEWIASSDNRVLKVDACSHGADNFFPGPTDIAWDLAGAIVEWEMDDSAAALLLSSYYEHSGDDADNRLAPFLLAYGAFRLSYCKMAAAANQGTSEELRLQKAYARYRCRLLQDLARNGYASGIRQTTAESRSLGRSSAR
jgi:hypothetical protein